MNRWNRAAVWVILAAGLSLAIAAGTNAETCTLELKRLESQRGYTLSDYVYRTSYPQRFSSQTGSPRPDDGFSAIVKKEPAEYVSQEPFRGVANLGSQKYAFVLDAKAPEAEPAEGETKDATSEKPKSSRPEAEAYCRMYFDVNHNGDLTDDGVIEADRESRTSSGTYVRCYFPPVNVTLDADGTAVDYAFSLYVYSRILGEDRKYVSASLNSAAYREGKITLDGKSRHVVLLDFNSNGRFDDEYGIKEGATYSGGGVVTEYGDMLLVDPDPNPSTYRSPYDPTVSEDRHLMSKLVNLDGRFYDLRVSVAGDKLTLTPSSAGVGHVTNPNEGFRAVVYGEEGFLKLVGGKSEPVPLPEGDWYLLSYTIDQTGYDKPPADPDEAEKKEEEEKEAPSLLESLTSALMKSTEVQIARPSTPRPTLVSARGTKDFKAVEVRQRETVAFPFGPPYKPVVKVDYRSGADRVYLGMSLVGSAGEVCTNLSVNGARPGKPEFTITAPDGEVVERGAFEYG